MTVVGVVPHVVEEVVDVRKEVVVGEDVVGVRDEVSSRARGLPKKLIALLPYRTRSSTVSEAYCLDLRCTPQAKMGKT